MKISTNERPKIKELIPSLILSAPREGPMVPSSTKFIGAASAPALSSKS